MAQLACRYGIVPAALVLSGLACGSVLAAPSAMAPPAEAVPISAAVRPTISAAAPAFELTLDAKAFIGAYSGRVYVVMTPGGSGKREPRLNVNNWFRPPMILSLDVRDVQPGQRVVVRGGASSLTSKPGEVITYPAMAAELTAALSKAERVTVQAIARLSKTGAVPGQSEGDIVSEPVVAEIASGDATSETEKPLALVLSRSVVKQSMKTTARVREFKMKSAVLSKFHGADYTVHAGIALPESWSEEARAKGQSWPIIYSVTGFGGDHREIAGGRGRNKSDAIVVIPDATNRHGHSVFADSANTGPWGEMLVMEMIPAIEQEFGGPISASAAGEPTSARLAASSARRVTTGVSSGGWSSLWLVVTYPDVFDSCWSHVPDPVDFRDFQRIDLTASAKPAGVNMYVDADGAPRPIARIGDTASLYYKEFVLVERALGAGGQIDSFEAVFSPKGADGLPMPIFDRATGNVDAKVAAAWEKYDIRLILERDWATLGPKLSGKLHVYAGEMDNFYLEGAARLLKDSLSALGSDAEVQIVEEMGHRLYGRGESKMHERIVQRQAEFAASQKK